MAKPSCGVKAATAWMGLGISNACYQASFYWATGHKPSQFQGWVEMVVFWCATWCWAGTLGELAAERWLRCKERKRIKEAAAWWTKYRNRISKAGSN